MKIKVFSLKKILLQKSNNKYIFLVDIRKQYGDVLIPFIVPLESESAAKKK